MRIGDVEVYIVSDGTFKMDGGAVFGLVPKVLWEKVITPDELNRVPMNLNCLLIISEGKRILVDTGMGDKLTPKERDIFGLYQERRLLKSLEGLGFYPEDIDIVINTHLHSDHCGGNTVAEGEEIIPTFPRDRTRAHQSILIESKGEKAFYLGDLAPWAINMEKLAWIPAFDVEPLETIETRRKIQQWAVEEKVILFFEHDPFFPAGYLVEENGRYTVKPLEF